VTVLFGTCHASSRACAQVGCSSRFNALSCLPVAARLITLVRARSSLQAIKKLLAADVLMGDQQH
jgi:hypothetical protein